MSGGGARLILESIPRRFRGAQIGELDPEVVACVVEFAADLPRRLKERRGLLISGPPGVGKTYALAALLAHYARRARVPTGCFVTSYEFVERYAPVVPTERSKDPLRGKAWTEVYDSGFMVVLNDIGKAFRGGKLADREAALFGRFLRIRNEAELPLFGTTNLPITAAPGRTTFRQVYGDSICSLVAEMADVFEVDGPDRRVAAADDDDGNET